MLRIRDASLKFSIKMFEVPTVLSCVFYQKLKVLQNMEELSRYSLENIRHRNPKNVKKMSMLLAYNMQLYQK